MIALLVALGKALIVTAVLMSPLIAFMVFIYQNEKYLQSVYKEINLSRYPAKGHEMTDEELCRNIDKFFEFWVCNTLEGRHRALDWELRSFIENNPDVSDEQWERVRPRIEYRLQQLGVYKN